MSDDILRIILEIIKVHKTIMPLFSIGYAYSKVVEWVNELERLGLICFDNDGYRILTDIGEAKYQNLCAKRKTIILPLSDVKRPQLSVEDIFLP